MTKDFIKQMQDPEGTGLSDNCSDKEISQDTNKYCSPCRPNPKEIIPNWTKLSKFNPFLNKRICKYQITIETEYDSIISRIPDADSKSASHLEQASEEILSDTFGEYRSEAIEHLLNFFNKDDSQESSLLVESSLENTDFYLDIRPKSRIKLLFSVPFDVINSLEDSLGENTCEEQSTNLQVRYTPDELTDWHKRVGTMLGVYSRNLKVFRAIENSNIVFEDGHLFNLEDYALNAGQSKTLFGNLIPELMSFLNSKGQSTDSIEYLTFHLSQNYNIEKLSIETTDGKKTNFIKKLKFLKTPNSSWTDPTALAYLYNLRNMNDDLTARVPPKWTSFIKKYTYPETTERSFTEAPSDSSGCLQEAMKKAGTQLGQDLLDPIFGLGDAVAYNFRELRCNVDADTLAKQKAQLKKLGIEDKDINTEMLYSLAKEQLYDSFDGDTIVSCETIFGGGTTETASDLFKEIRANFDRLKMCGLLDLLTDAYRCLMSGLSLEQSLSSITLSAINSMSIGNLGKLFIGLPLEKQEEIDSLVRDNLSSGTFFGDDSANKEAFDDIVGNFDYNRPWEEDDSDKLDSMSRQEGPQSQDSYGISLTVEQKRVRTLGGSTTIDRKVISVVLQAYREAIVKSYADDLLSLVDYLGKFPGSSLISSAMQIGHCPSVPLFNPSFPDYINSFELPICRDMKEISFPRLVTPPYDKFVDLWQLILNAAKIAIAQMIHKLLFILMKRVCELANAGACGALDLAGDLARNISDENNTLREVIRESICDSTTEEEVLDETIKEIFGSLGAGDWGNSQRVSDFTADMSRSTTPKEISDALLGNPSPEFLNIVATIAAYEYPELAPSFKNHLQTKRLFKNIGNLLPLDFKSQMRQKIDNEISSNRIPANPSLCASDEQITLFKDYRCELLAGRVTPNQCEHLQPSNLDDISTLGDILQGGVSAFIDDNMPPMVSDSGCDDGVFPREPKVVAQAVSLSLTSQMETLQSEYITDMLGNGPTKKNWGLFNMILSDTLGAPLSTHHRKTDNRRNRVDFYSETEPEDADERKPFSPFLLASALAAYASSHPKIETQRGAYPLYVGEWLKSQMENESHTFNLDNQISRVDDTIQKTTPGIVYTFKDNARGIEDYKDSYGYGFEIKLHFSELTDNLMGKAVNKTAGYTPTSEHSPVPSDFSRIEINEMFNASFNPDASLLSLFPLANLVAKNLRADMIFKESKFNFIVSEDTFEDIDLRPFANFVSTFSSYRPESPQATLLKDILASSGTEASMSSTIRTLNLILGDISSAIWSKVTDNESSFLYGAKYDSLTTKDAEYVVSDGQTNSAGGTIYSEAEIISEDGSLRKINNKDEILGMSRMQYEINSGIYHDPSATNRVYFLEPSKYGGSYINPPVSLVPIENDGWLGFMEVLFPEHNEVVSESSNIIGFEDIGSLMDSLYPKLSDDLRMSKLQSDFEELPYDRLMVRSSKAFMHGLVTAAIRIFCSTSIIKSLNVNSVFPIDSSNLYGSTYASYLAETMKDSFLDPQGAEWDWISAGLDTDFWYAFLEQSVQIYSRRIEMGEINPPNRIKAALTRLNDLQEAYEYPSRQDLKTAKYLKQSSPFETLRGYRLEQNFDAIKVSEEDAKMILIELIKEQLDYLGAKIIKRTPASKQSMQIFDADLFLLNEIAVGADINVKSKLSEIKGSTIGEIADYGVTDYESKSLVIEKFISIQGVKFSNAEALEILSEHTSPSDMISDVYLGNLKLIKDKCDHIVGIDGKMSIQYGLVLSVIVDGNKREITSIEMNPVDTEVRLLPPIESNSDLLLCLIKKLKEDNVFRLISEYIFPTRKLVSMAAIYADMGLLPSIGEKTVEDGETWKKTTLTSLFAGVDTFDDLKKPGVYASPEYDGEGNITNITLEGNEGWSSSNDRSTWSPFYLEWDEWDKVLVRNSKSRIKKLFKMHYKSRDFDIKDINDGDSSPTRVKAKELKEKMQAAPSDKILPWYRRRNLRPKPTISDD